MTKQRCLAAWPHNGDRLDILCFDGNSKLYRRTCGAPCAKTYFVEALGIHLVRGCLESPEQRGVLYRRSSGVCCTSTMQLSETNML